MKIQVGMVTAAAAMLLLASAPAAQGSEGETLAFVLSDYRDTIPPDVKDGCPEGLNKTEEEIYGVTFKDWSKEAKKTSAAEASRKIYGGDACSERGSQKDPGWQSFNGDIPMAGMNLDGKTSAAKSGGKCAHSDFTGPDGTAGIDNQHWRLLGCTKAYQPQGQMDRMWESGNFIKEGIPMLVEVRGVDDRMNDDSVEVRILSSSDTVSMDGNGSVVPFLSLREHEDERYRNGFASGRIENGVLISDPIDIRLKIKQQVLNMEFFYRDARIRAELTDEGLKNGVLGFYWDGDNFYEAMNDHYIGTYHSGRIAALTRGYSCAGMDHVLPSMLDGHPDPETGDCTSLSSAILFEAVPAFVIPAS